MTRRQQLCVVHGMGNDAVGLVGRLTAPIAEAGANILDLRQDVLHGLFTIYMVVDLTGTGLDVEAFRERLGPVAEDTGLSITVDRFCPVARRPDKRNLLVILIGADKPGIIAASSEMLGKYNANIELAQTIAREGVFLMELLTDVSHAAIPVENLKRTLSRNMAQLDIQAVFQEEHVFLKRKRLLLFTIASSFIDVETAGEILRQAGVTAEEAADLAATRSPADAFQRAARKLDGLPLDVVETVLQGVSPTAGSMELLQTLKVMGYRIALASTAFSFVTDYLRRRLGIDHAFGVPCRVDDDARTLTDEVDPDAAGVQDVDSLIDQLTAVERIERDDVAVISDERFLETPGIRLRFDLDVLLGCLNQRALSRENLIGLLGAFGVPRPEWTRAAG